MKARETSLLDHLFRLFKHIETRKKIQILILVILMFFASVAEIFSIGAVLPFLGVLTDPNKIFNHRLAKNFVDAFNLKSSEELLLPITILFSFVMLFTGVIRLLLLWVQTRISYSIGADISFNIYRKTLFQPYLYLQLANINTGTNQEILIFIQCLPGHFF